jgi:hypothetical protein
MRLGAAELRVRILCGRKADSDWHFASACVHVWVVSPGVAPDRIITRRVLAPLLAAFSVMPTTSTKVASRVPATRGRRLLAPSEPHDALGDLARGLRGIVLGWEDAPPSKTDHETVTRKVLGLHIAARRIRIAAEQ